MDKPFVNQFIEMLTDLTPEGGVGNEYSELTSDQRATVDEMLGDGENRDEYNALMMMGKAINQLNRVVSGFTSSDDIEINYDPASSATLFKLRKKKQEEATGGADLGTATRERMVYQRLDDEDGDPRYGFDYVRLV